VIGYTETMALVKAVTWSGSGTRSAEGEINANENVIWGCDDGGKCCPAK
jgi:hypothetical protein